MTARGADLSLGGPKPRAVLGALLLQRGVVVSVDRLVTAAWGYRAPPDAAGSLRTYVSRLRSVLDRDAACGPVYRAPGYVLEVGDDQLDSAQFTNLVGEARSLASIGDHAGALRSWDGALGLWRGEALAEFDPLLVDPGAELARLSELRLIATEERAESLLRLGRARAAVAELEALLRRCPERETVAVLLMRALYACGRQADALATYSGLRLHLVSELGVEPCEPTRAVHRQLLNHDPDLVPERAWAGSSLPRRGTDLVGRAEDSAGVAAALRRGRLVTITGVGGVGKSRLAVEVAHRERPRFADGVWLCELASLATGVGVSRAVAAELGVHPRAGLTLAAALAEYLSDRQVLLILDNCEHVLAETAALVDLLMSRCGRAAILTTSREALSVGGEQLWPLEPLDVQDAVTLFLQRARVSRPQLLLDPRSAVAVTGICRRLDGLPLAIELAAARMPVMSAEEVLGRLGDAGLLTEVSRTRERRHQSLASTIEWSYQLLAAAERRLFVRMSIFAGGADLAAVHAVCGETASTELGSLDLVTALVAKSMVVVRTGPGPTRFRVLETLRSFGSDRRTADDDLARRHTLYFVNLAEAAAGGVQGCDEAAWIERTLPDGDNFRVAFEHAVAGDDVDLALRLVSSLAEVSQLRLGFESAGWAERAVDLAPADHPLFVAAVGAAARGAWNVGDFDRARSLALRAAGRTPARGSARTAYPADVLADIALYQGEVDQTLVHYAASVEVARGDGDPIRLVWSLYYVAVCQAVRREPTRGLAAAQECLSVADSTGNPTARSMARYALGLVLKKSQPLQALTLFDEAAGLAASVHNLWWQGVALMEAAATRAVWGDPLLAAHDFLDVLDHWQRVGDLTQQWLNLRYVTRLLVRLGAREEALVLHHAITAAGKPSPLDATRAHQLLAFGSSRLVVTAAHGRALRVTDAVAYAKESLVHVV
ncbi:MAG: BTAD domain-containing putative transcriptional regulator [Mycobacteriaceae bacterium]